MALPPVSMATPLWGGSSGGGAQRPKSRLGYPWPESTSSPKLCGVVRIPQFALSPRNLIKSTIVPRRASGRRDGEAIALVGSFWEIIGYTF